MYRTHAVLLTIFLACSLAACGGEEKGTSGTSARRAKPNVFTTFLPTTYFTKRIAGDAAVVICPVPGDADPIFWDPDDASLARYQDESDLIVINGAEFEKWVLASSLPENRIVDTAKGFKDRFVTFEGGGDAHSHGDGSTHAHEGLDGHTWVDPLLSIKQAEAIHAALVRAWPEHKDTYDSGLASLIADLRKLHDGFRALGAVTEGQHLYASHPAYNYLAKRYGWPIVNLDLDPEEVPDADTLADIKKRLGEQAGSYLLWEGEPTAEVAKAVADATGLKNATVSPCETDEDGADYLARMMANIQVLKGVFGK